MVQPGGTRRKRIGSWWDVAAWLLGGNIRQALRQVAGPVLGNHRPASCCGAARFVEDYSRAIPGHGGSELEARPPVPPFSSDDAVKKVRAAEDAWNTRDPHK